MTKPLVFLDTETTGLDPLYHEIIEICMVKHTADDAGKIECPERSSQVYEMIMPEWPSRIHPKAAEVNGFNEDEWEAKGAICFHECADEIANYIEGCTIVGFNPWFDIRFLLSEMSRIGHEIPVFDYHAVDLCSLAHPLHILGEMTGCNAKAICAYFNIDYSGAHRACNDVELSIECYRRFMDLTRQLP
jgi:DNA polymerase-3 subunit epsilon